MQHYGNLLPTEDSHIAVNGAGGFQSTRELMLVPAVCCLVFVVLMVEGGLPLCCVVWVGCTGWVQSDTGGS